jgi:tRNA pseudouridine13 synthase
MKLKQLPDDFQVEEVPEVQPGPDGAFAFYRLEKRGWTTPDALAALRRRWKIDGRRLSYGGLKDRHAWTIQYLTIWRGPQRNFHHQQIAVEYLGQLSAPYNSHAIRHNRFVLTLRDLTSTHADAAMQRGERLKVEGVPNYFDDQRFGSVGAGEEFIARLLVKGQFEDALRLALTAPYEFDRAAQKEEKRLLVEHWGDWAQLKDRLPRGHARSLVDYLRVHSGDFRGAVARLRPELRGLYLSAYQSHLWNQLLARWLRQHCRPEQLASITLRLGKVPVHTNLDPSQQQALADLSLPLPSARLHLEANDPRLPLVESVLAEEELTLRDLQVKGIREMFFSKGERAALCVPIHFTVQQEADEIHPGKRKLLLRFELARGCYATMVVKHLTAPEAPRPRFGGEGLG